ncbi:adenylate kinase [Galdieria sulphuraria]|uniref:Adenylate kinase n=1 Tax=Galdieria sulphuraria TaxID=130081 RepID=M2W9A8_GALSU|nr:adenylate kinase [Galdieria sulphuraria]EME32456.1 adenylate kinase [Galdieria sulphuraria]|eukprot:XP_005708976.1 adenylate kinase [Galdieria sulphuraria]
MFTALRRLCHNSKIVLEKPSLVVFLGAPGVGKGTYASRVAPLLDFSHVSLGEEFRTESKHNVWLRSLLEEGKLVPDDFVLNRVLSIIRNLSSKCQGIILDGFPRTREQAVSLNRVYEVDAVYRLTLREDILVHKMSFRRVCHTCGKTFNLANITEPGYEMPPLLPPSSCQGPCELVQRDDDKEEVVRSRLKIYREMEAPIEQFYNERGILYTFELKGGVSKMLPELVSFMSKTLPNHCSLRRISG